MPRKSILSLFICSSNQHRHSPDKPGEKLRSIHSFSSAIMEENISNAESIIRKYDLSSPKSNLAPLFYDTREESAQFCHAVRDLQRAMIFFTSNDCIDSPRTRSQSAVRAQSLMQVAMKRLEKEFHQILSSNRDKLDPESVSHHRSARSSVSDPDLESEDETIRTVGDSFDEVARASAIAMADLKTIAETMIDAGYGKECVKVYKSLRKSIVDEGLYRLGFEKSTLAQIQKLDWELLDLKIRSWIDASPIAIRTLLSGERILCDHVFAGSDSIRDSCFAEITIEAAVQFVAFPELVARLKRSPERLFRILDLYSSMSDHFSDIESVFSCESTEAVRSQAQSTLSTLREAARSTVAEFESAIQKNASKSLAIGGGVHQLTIYAMNYLIRTADYELILADIFADFPLQAPASPSSSLESMPSPISIRIEWLIFVLLCKLDGKSEIYKEAAQSYLFLTNNLQYIVKIVKESKLMEVVGEDWVLTHESKARHYASSYERLAWARMAAAVPAAGEEAAAAAERITGFYAAFEEAVRVQREWVVFDEGMREEMRELAAELIVQAYRGFYETYRPIFESGDVVVVRYAPEDLRRKLMELFSGSGSSSVSDKSSWWSSISTH